MGQKSEPTPLNIMGLLVTKWLPSCALCVLFLNLQQQRILLRSSPPFLLSFPLCIFGLLAWLRHLVIESEHVHGGHRILLLSADVAESQTLPLSFAVVVLAGDLLPKWLAQAGWMLLCISSEEFGCICALGAELIRGSRIVLVSWLFQPNKPWSVLYWPRPPLNSIAFPYYYVPPKISKPKNTSV